MVIVAIFLQKCFFLLKKLVVYGIYVVPLQRKKNEQWHD